MMAGRIRAGRLVIAAATALAVVLGGGAARAGEAGTLLAAHLERGTIAAGETALGRLAAATPQDAEAQFALGAAQFIAAVEGLGQEFHRHGLDAPDAFGMPLFRMPVPKNAAPEPLSYGELRAILKRFVERMERAEATLAEVGAGEPKIVLDLSRVRLDLDGDGEAGEAERLVTLLAVADPTGLGLAEGGAPQGGAGDEGGAGPRLVFAFDRADAVWLRGYAQLLMSFADFLLAHDFSALFDGTFHVLFPGAGLPMEDLSGSAMSRITPDDTLLADAIAFVHLVRWPVAEPERMAKVRARLLAVVALSRENWRLILTETDDDREWLPAPRQTTPFPGLEVSEAHVAGWLALLDSAEALLEGEVLLPHWRLSRGIDLKRVFEEPQSFDLVLWLTGRGALPFLSDGPMLGGEAAGAVGEVFGGELLRYAVWFN